MSKMTVVETAQYRVASLLAISCDPTDSRSLLLIESLANGRGLGGKCH